MKSIVGKLVSDRYFILKELRQEHAVALYLAQDRNSSENTQCQIERLHFSHTNSVANFQTWQNLAKLFQSEAAALAELGQHPQIPRILDYFIEEREFYLVSELSYGKSLKEHVRQRHLTEPEAILWLQSTLEILEFIHQKQIFHLNIRPENLIQSQPEGKISLTNFGSVRNSLELFFSHIQTRDIGGDYIDEYVPLEQWLGTPNYTSDLYTLGKVIIYALTGEIPKRRDINSANYQKPLLTEISDRTGVNISYKLNRILTKMIEEDSSARYQTATEVLVELQQQENIVALPLPFATFSEKKPPALKPQTKSKSNIERKAWLSLLLCLPFIVAAIVFFIGINRSADRNFLPYINDTYYLAIKYPQKWSPRELEDPITGEIVVFSAPLENDSDLFSEKVYLSIEYLTLDSMNLDEYLQTTIDRIQQEGNQLETTPQKTELDNNPAITIVYSRTERGLRLKVRETFTKINNRVYIVTYVAEASEYNKYLDVVTKMLASLDIEAKSYIIE